MDKKENSCVIGGARIREGRLEIFAMSPNGNEAGEPVPENASAESFFVGIRADNSNAGVICHIVESSGKSVEETAQRLLAADRELNGENSFGTSAAEIPMAETADIMAPGLFVIEATERLYQEVSLVEGKHVAGRPFGDETPLLVLACRITVSANGSLIADAYELDPEAGITGVRIVEEPFEGEESKPSIILIDRVKARNNGLQIQFFRNRKQGIETLQNISTPKRHYVSLMLDDQLTGIVHSNGHTAEEAAENCRLNLKNFLEVYCDADMINTMEIPSVEKLLSVPDVEDFKPGNTFVLPCTNDLYHAVSRIEKKNRIGWATTAQRPMIAFVTCRMARTRDGTLIATLSEEDRRSPDGEQNHFSPSPANLVASEE